MAEEIEKIYVIPLNKKGFKRSKAAPTAVKRVKSYLTKHMKVEEEKVWIDSSLNNAIWSKGRYSMDSKIRVKAVKFDDGVVEAYLPELEFKKSRREILKEEKAKKEPILKKEEKPVEEGEEVSGAEGYDIAPTADGEVKIKKKKTPKEKTEKTEGEVKEKKPVKKEETAKKQVKPKEEKKEKTEEPKKKIDDTTKKEEKPEKTELKKPAEASKKTVEKKEKTPEKQKPKEEKKEEKK